MSGPPQVPDWGPVSLELPIDAPDAGRPALPASGEPGTSVDGDFVIVIDGNDEDADDEDGIRRRGNVIEIDLA